MNKVTDDNQWLKLVHQPSQQEGVSEAEYVVDLIHEVLSDINNESNISSVKNKVKDLCKGFPVYLQ